MFVHHTKTRPYLNMMRVTVIDKPSSEERVMVTHEGKEACCYAQGNAWDWPSCEDIFPSVMTPNAGSKPWTVPLLERPHTCLQNRPWDPGMTGGERERGGDDKKHAKT